MGNSVHPTDSSYPESPVLLKRDSPMRGKLSETSRKGKLGVSLSLSQVKIERWSLVEKIKALENQVAEMDVLTSENIRLQRELQESEGEKEMIRAKFADINDKLKGFMAKEQFEKDQLESELRAKTEEVRSKSLDQDALRLENARLRKEIELVEDEMLKMKQLNASCIDRSIHDRVVSDLKRETEQLRLSLKDSISRTIFERTLKQIEELNDHLKAKSTCISELEQERIQLCTRIGCLEKQDIDNTRLIEKLKSELSTLEDSNESFQKRLIQVERMSAASLKEDQLSISSLREELRDSERKITELLSELNLKAERERRFHLESGIARRSIESVKLDKLRLAGKINDIRQETESLKNSIRNSAMEHERYFIDQMKTVQSFYEHNLSEFRKGVWRSLQQFNLIDQLEDPPATLTELVIVLRSILCDTSKEISDAREDMFILKSELSQKDFEITELKNRLDVLAAGKKEDDSVLNEFRRSIESIESNLRSSRRFSQKPM